ncbi:MAG: hypothetical protein IT424_08835 [Pirellulales bacterium]|nr:hypothetical protein [Pirellulales bacterium]
MAKRKEYRARNDAEQRFQGLLIAVRAIVSLPEKVDQRVKKKLLKSCLWQLTQSHCFGKYNLQYASRAAAIALEAGDNSGLRHEHVYPIKQVIAELLQAKLDGIEAILRRKAVACCVTSAEHERLSGVSSDCEGWQRYREAGIDVVNREKGEVAPFDDLRSD